MFPQRGAAEIHPNCGGGRRTPPFEDDAIKLLGHETIKLLGYEAIRLYGHMAVNTELHSQILNLVRNPFTAEPIRTFPKLTSHKLELLGMGTS